jgi:hypothetical protein
MQSIMHIFPILLLLAFGQAVAQKEREVAFLLPSKKKLGLHVTYFKGTDVDFSLFIERSNRLKSSEKYEDSNSCTVQFIEFRLTRLGKIEDIKVSSNVTKSLQEALKAAVKDSEPYWIPKRINGKPVDTHIVYNRKYIKEWFLGEVALQRSRRLSDLMEINKKFGFEITHTQQIKILYPQYSNCYLITNAVIIGEPRVVIPVVEQEKK